MSRLRLGSVAFFLFITGCGTTTGSGFKTIVEYHLLAEADACIKVRASPQTPAGQTKENSHFLKGKSKDGVATFGILIGDDWSGDVTVTASLHVPCASTIVRARDLKRERAPTRGKVVQLQLRLDEGARAEGGTDGGSFDGGADGGEDGGEDGGGADAGVDAGTLGCDAGIGIFIGPPMMGGTWHDVAPYAPGRVWLAGSGALYWRAPSGWISAGSTCAGEHHAAWARSDGRVYFGTNDAGLRYADPDAGSVCQLLTAPTGAGPTGDVYGIWGIASTGVLYSVTLGGTVLRNTDPEVPSVNRRWDLRDAGGRELWTVAGFDENSLFAGGRSTSGNDGVIFKHDPLTDLWVKQTVTINEVVNDISVVSPTLAYAGTEGHELFVWNGVAWSLVDNSFGRPIYGLVAFSSTAVYAVGDKATVRLWDGNQWSTLDAFDAGPNGYLSRIRGLTRCELWSAGSRGLVVRSQ